MRYSMSGTPSKEPQQVAFSRGGFLRLARKSLSEGPPLPRFAMLCVSGRLMRASAGFPQSGCHDELVTSVSLGPRIRG